MNNGYDILENKIPSDVIDYLQSYTMIVKERLVPQIGKDKEVGSGIYWKGLDMASMASICTDDENYKLFNVYTSKFMYDVITDYIPEPYLFNDQIVVKLPHEDMKFEPHYDNQYGPFPNDKELVTINCMLILDDYTDENGAIKVFDERWITLYPKIGDILLIEGNTLHSSENNNSDYSRRSYICVYTNKSIGKGFQQGFYHEQFIIRTNEMGFK